MKQFLCQVLLATIFLVICISGHAQGEKAGIITIRKSDGNGNWVIHAFRNLPDGLKATRKAQRPLLLIFSGWALSGPDYEWRPLAEYVGISTIEKKYVIVWLAVDSRRVAAANYYKTYGLGSKRYRTEGDYNTQLQLKLTNSVSQPVYCVTDTLLRPLRIAKWSADSMALKRLILSK